MAYALDTLGYTKHLEGAGIDRQQAEAPAQAAREFIMTELVTKTDLPIALDNVVLKTTIGLGAIIVASVTFLGVVLKIH